MEGQGIVHDGKCVGEPLLISFKWEYVVLGLMLSFFASFAGLSSLSYALQLRDRTSGDRFRLAYFSLILAAGMSLGGCGIWTMHFFGMSAEILTTCDGATEVPKRYNLLLTAISLAVAVISCTVAMHFAVPGLRHRQEAVGSSRVFPFSQLDDVRSRRKKPSGPEFWVLHGVKFRGRLVKIVKVDLWRFAASTVCLGLGAVGMHYMGMRAEYTMYVMEFRPAVVFASVVVALVVAGVGLFIVVQASHLGRQANTTAPRALAAAIIAGAVNCVHYTGALSAVYYFTGDYAKSPMHGLGLHLEIPSLIVGIASLSVSLLQLMLCQHISESVYAQQKKENDALRRKLPADDVPSRLNDIYERVRAMRGGKVADYIPELSKADPDHFGISVCDINGDLYSVGDVAVPFTIQSCCKPILYMMAAEELGVAEVTKKINTEPSGLPFDALSIDPSNRAFNPFVNAGAMVSASLISANDRIAGCPEEIFECFQVACEEMVLEPVRCRFDTEVFLSEMQTNSNNRSIAAELAKRGIISEAPESTVDTYTRCCSMLTTTEDAAVMAATMANKGTNPTSNEEVFDSQVVEHTVTVMMSCGMYNGAGRWMTDVGIPAKSGVAGLVMGVVPGVCGIAVYSPPLDENGNSVRGVEVARQISDAFSLHTLKSTMDVAKMPSNMDAEARKKARRARGSGPSSRMSMEGAGEHVISMQQPAAWGKHATEPSEPMTGIPEA